jgi:hypothetical protein
LRGILDERGDEVAVAMKIKARPGKGDGRNQQAVEGTRVLT